MLNVVLVLPTAIAVAHNGVAALIVLSLLTLNYALNYSADKKAIAEVNSRHLAVTLMSLNLTIYTTTKMRYPK